VGVVCCSVCCSVRSSVCSVRSSVFALAYVDIFYFFAGLDSSKVD